MLSLLGVITGWTGLAIAKAIVIFVVVVGIVWIVLQVCGVTIPDWLLKIFGLCVLGFVAILAIEFMWSL